MWKDEENGGVQQQLKSEKRERTVVIQPFGEVEWSDGDRRDRSRNTSVGAQATGNYFGLSGHSATSGKLGD
jgi:hypothetical protein